MKKLLLLSLLGFAAACSENDFPEYAALDRLRVLALVVDAAGKSEVNPGETVTLIPWVSDVGNGGPWTTEVEHCLDLGGASLGEPSCAGNPTRQSAPSGTITTLNAGNTFTAEADSFTVQVPANALDNRTPQAKYNGVSYLVFYKVTSATGASVSSFKRILVSDPAKTAKNSNPVLNSVRSAGTAFTTLPPGPTYTLTPEFAAGSSESYSYLKDDGSLATATETMITTWFYTDGEMKFERTLGDDANEYKIPNGYPTTRSAFLILVARDGRGGTAVLKATTK